MSSNFITFSSGIIHTPLEQFEIIPIIPFSFGIFDFSITNEAVILGLIFFFGSVFYSLCYGEVTIDLRYRLVKNLKKNYAL